MIFGLRESVSRWPGVGAGALLVLFAAVAYSPILSCGFIWDDNDYVENNKTLEAPAGLVRIWTEPTASPQYYPLVFTTFWIERRLYALDPAGYHVVNVLLHAASGIVLWRILRRLAVPAAWFAAALFVLHPVEVESVAWITERKNVLSGFFYLTSALAYVTFRPPLLSEPRPLGSGNLVLDGLAVCPPSRSGLGNAGLYGISLLLFVLALLSKTVTCSLPAALLLIYWWKRPRLAWRDVGPLLPMFAIGAGLAYVTVWMEKHHVGAEGIDFELTPVDRILIAGRAVCFYFGKLVLPTNLAFIYPRWKIDPASPEQWAYPAIVLFALAAAWFGRWRVGKGPLVALLFFVGTLLPALGFIDVYPMRFSFVADHFQYLASIGPLTLIATAGKSALEAIFEKRPRMPALIGAAWLAALGMTTWAQIPIYTSREELWTDTARKDPESWIAHHNLAEQRFAKIRTDPKALEDARRHYLEAIRLKPGEWMSHYGEGQTYWNEIERDPEMAQPYFEEAIRLKPDATVAHFMLGAILQKTGKTKEAIAEYEQALALQPSYADAHYNLAAALASERRFAEAIPHFEFAVKAQPREPIPQFGLAMAYREVGKTALAKEALRRLVGQHPEEPQFREALDAMK